MYTSFFGLEIAKKALFAQRLAQDVVGHNIANAGTEGYSRQRAEMVSLCLNNGSGFYGNYTSGQMGLGVAVQEVYRMRDEFLDGQYRNENQLLGEWEARSSTLSQIEDIFNNLGDEGLSSVMDEFWSSLEDLSENPEDPTLRSIVREDAITLCNTINTIYKKLNQVRTDANEEIGILVNQVNSIAKQIADLNAQIRKVEISGNTANDLRDKRDLLLDELSGIVDIDVSEDADGNFTVSVGGTNLVKGMDYNRWEFNEASFVPTDKSGGEFVAGPSITWAGLNRDVTIKSGELKGLLDTRDETATHYMEELERMVLGDGTTDGFITAFNNIHNSAKNSDGTTYALDDDGNIVEADWDFFVAGDISDGELINISDDISDSANNIAAALKLDSETETPGAGDNRNALALAALKQSVTIDGGGFDDFVNAMVSGDLGVKSQEAQRMVENEELLVSQLDTNRKSVSGVSLDEEMTNMIKYQQAYNAAARMVTTMDEMLDVIISQMGVVGR